MKVPMATLIIDNYDSFTYNLVHAVAGITASRPSWFETMS